MRFTTSKLRHRNRLLILLVGMNCIATGILFLLTFNTTDPIIAPISQPSMLLRWLVIATVIGFLQFCLIQGWRRKSHQGHR